MQHSVHIDDVPYLPDSCELFARIRELGDPVFLDSSYPHTRAGRYDILAAGPIDAALPPPPAPGDELAARDYLAELSRCHSDHFGTVSAASPDLPFCGGLIGYLGYGFGESLEGVSSARSGPPLSEAVCVALYDWCVVQDHRLQRAALICQPRVSPSTRQDLLRRLRRPAVETGDSFRLASAFQANISESNYNSTFEKVQAYIHAGDCYQVNLSQQFSAHFDGDPWQAYRALRATAAAPFAAYLERDGMDCLLSLSPERFLSLHGQHVETSPIKGTRPRYADAEADRLAVEELRNSAKDRAENLMIVDLLRNDLGRGCVPGSIHVDRLFEIQSFPTVHHMVSTVSGELAPGRTAFDLMRDCFPGGSITGAPKRRSMEIIAELEPHHREVYCGSVFYVSADGRMDSNIAIRTLLGKEGRLHCWGGGGIVADSQWQQEYQETYDKVGKLMTTLERTGS